MSLDIVQAGGPAQSLHQKHVPRRPLEAPHPRLVLLSPDNFQRRKVEDEGYMRKGQEVLIQFGILMETELSDGHVLQ